MDCCALVANPVGRCVDEFLVLAVKGREPPIFLGLKAQYPFQAGLRRTFVTDLFGSSHDLNTPKQHIFLSAEPPY